LTAVPRAAALLDLTRGYYTMGHFDYADAYRLADVLSARDELMLVCPVAVLQALLLKLEENLPYEPRAYQDIMGAYVRYFHQATANGALSEDDLRQWPLMQGLERVESQSNLLATRSGATSAMVLNFCAAKDRFGEVHELRWLLEPPFGDPARTAEFGGAEMGLLLQTDLYIYLVDAPKCKWLGSEIVEKLKKAVRSVQLVPYKGGPTREEQTAYFKFLADNYETLPDFTIFVHPDAPEHQGAEFVALRRALKLIHTGSALAHHALQYYPLAQQMVVEPKRTWGSIYAAEWVEFWDAIFDRPWQDYQFVPPRCHWASHAGQYLAGLVEGTDEGLTRTAAKAACVAAGDACAGITCGTPAESEEGANVAGADAVDRRGGSCSARRGGGGGPIQSPDGMETSYVKRCGNEGRSGHEDAVFPHEVPINQIAASTAYAEHSGSYLAGYAAGDSQERSPESSLARCEELGASCAGFTCEPGGDPCTVRRGTDPQESLRRERSFVKTSKHGSTRFPAPNRGGGDALFQLYTGSQSVVHRDRIRAWSKSKLAALGADGEFCSKYSGLYEAVWHAMFGEPLAQLPRERDPRLPLYLKWMILTFYSSGDEGVI